jgi:serine/threonine-protein kinase
MATWNIIRTIDEGGFGKVYEVKSTTGERGALKELLRPDPERLKRFAREIGIIQSLNHTNIVNILDSNINGNPPTLGPWYVMEFMAGGSLKNKMYDMFNVRKGLFAQKWALGNVILPVAKALQLAHASTIYHRDIKPANLLFTEQNQIKVADWGIGKDVNKESIKLTIGGIGTPGYCSPEQWFHPSNFGEVNQRTDIYSLGIVFYEMMTGKIPSVYNDLNGQRYNVPKPSSQNHPSISTELDNAILKMIALNQNERYQNMQDVINTLTLIYNNLK